MSDDMPEAGREASADTTAPDAITQADREDLAAAAERAGCKVVPSAIRDGEATLISTHIALDALAHRRLAAHGAGEGLREALAFYADPDGDGYRVDVTNYGLSTEEGDIVRDGGKRAREALALLTPPTDAGSTRREGGEYHVFRCSCGSSFVTGDELTWHRQHRCRLSSDPDGWIQVKVNNEGGIVAPYGRMVDSPDRPGGDDMWAPFFFGAPR